VGSGERGKGGKVFVQGQELVLEQVLGRVEEEAELMEVPLLVVLCHTRVCIFGIILIDCYVDKEIKFGVCLHL
jgi:hypothetical protein